MKRISISDTTMKGASLTFREKLELAKLLDRLGVSVIETEAIENLRADSLLIKSVASAVKQSTVAVPVKLSSESVAVTWNALKEAKSARLQVFASVSPVQMEYLFHKKPAAMLALIRDTVAECKKYTDDVEFIAGDATRSDLPFLTGAMKAAVEAGASVVTLCDDAGNMLPSEFCDFIDSLYAAVPELKDITLGISCCDMLAMANACSVAAISHGVGEIKAKSYGTGSADLADIAKVLSVKSDVFGAAADVHMTELKRIMGKIAAICDNGKNGNSPFDDGVREDDNAVLYTHRDDKAAVLKAAEKLGYEISEEDGEKVYAAFRRIAERKDQISMKELDAIVAAEAMQVPPAYTLESYVINTGNVISSTAHIRLKRNGTVIDGLMSGDGAIDAAFLAIEKIAGKHYELDDFQIQAVTEGREAVGQTVVKLRSNGRLFSGRGISTDIVGAGIMAYVNALNKIVYEEEDA